MNALVTGGAGFIGSHLVDTLVSQGHRALVFDDFSTGREENLNPGAEVRRGDVADPVAIRKATEGMDVVFHLGALGSVARSIDNPLGSDRANTHGTLAVLSASVDAGVRRVVFASSSSVYGGARERPTPETAPLCPRSPYAVTKLTGEHYCRVFSEVHGLETVALRFFNVFGPRQRPDSAYAAVIPLFVDALLAGRSPTVHGDGRQSRDFTYVSNVVAACLRAAEAPATACSGNVYNIACGREHSLLDLLSTLGAILGVDPRPVHVDPRPGDVRHSRADITRARQDLGFEPAADFEEGLRRTAGWFRSRQTAP
jgi:nucleoside-diphosphate-sugar epimerase